MGMKSTSREHIGQIQFPPALGKEELAARLENIRWGMDADDLDLTILTDVKNIRYFRCYRTLHWHSVPGRFLRLSLQPFVNVEVTSDLALAAEAVSLS